MKVKNNIPINMTNNKYIQLYHLLNKLMKKHTNPKTGEFMTLNLNSQEIPRYLHPSHGQFY